MGDIFLLSLVSLTIGFVIVILGFNLMLLILLEVPLVGYLVAPERWSRCSTSAPG